MVDMPSACSCRVDAEVLWIIEFYRRSRRRMVRGDRSLVVEVGEVEFTSVSVKVPFVSLSPGAPRSPHAPPQLLVPRRTSSPAQ